MSLALVSAGTAGEHDQQWAQPLATPGDDVLGDLVDERNRALQAGANHSVDGSEVAPNEGADVIQSHRLS